MRTSEKAKEDGEVRRTSYVRVVPRVARSSMSSIDPAAAARPGMVAIARLRLKLATCTCRPTWHRFLLVHVSTDKATA